MAAANGAVNGAGLQSHSLDHEAYTDDDDAGEDVRLASALLPCSEITKTNDHCDEL